ncbi:MAG TPA: AraC family transcriptional regulator [Pseudonocardiaceae bacterium]|jgi:AraC-like DNA-binding protein|nr:AraC family transcriptional regulator [Pseudonocardiaceae bacterium]
MPTPLERYRLFDTTDLDCARDAVSRIFTDHQLDLLDPQSHVTARMNSRRLQDTALNFLSYGAHIRVKPDRLDTFYLVQIPLSGRAEIRCGAEHIYSQLGNAPVLSPTEPLLMHWSADCSQLLARIERSALEGRLRDLIDEPIRAPLRFAAEMDVSTGQGLSWRRLLEAAVADFDGPALMAEHALVAHDFEQTLMTALLLAQASNYTDKIQDAVDAVGGHALSRAARIAVDWIENHPEYQHTTASLARSAGVSERTLQISFRNELDMPPTDYLRDVRLRRVHDDLRAADPSSVTVAEVAARWGFLHPGHFSARYSRKFGESPSQTLRRSG